MKYFNELSNIESEIISLDNLKSVVTVASNGIDSSNPSDIENTVWYFRDSLNSIVGNLYRAHQELFDTVSDEYAVERILSTNDYIKPSVYSLELDVIVSNWIKT